MDMKYTNARRSGPGKHSSSGVKQTTRGTGVQSGLSMQQGFHNESNRSMGLDTKSGARNQVPIHPRKGLSTDRGSFTCY